MANTTIRKEILRVNAIYLLIASVLGICMDVAGIFFSRGPESRIVAGAPYAGIGFLEAHGLACVIGVLLWHAKPLRFWHLTAATVQFLLGTCNLIFWQIFVAANFLWGGYVYTSLHWLFVIVQLFAAMTAGERASEPAVQRPLAAHS